MKAALWLRVSTDNKGQDPELQRADLERVARERGWEVVRVYSIEESAFGKRRRAQFQAMLEAARRNEFNVLMAWSLDRFSREGEWSVMRVMAALQDWHVQFYSYSEPFLDTSTPFAGVLLPLFAWLARQESVRKGNAVRLGLEKARAQGKTLGRPALGERLDVALMVRLRTEGKSWAELQAAHPVVRLPGGRRGRPSLTSIRRAVAAASAPAAREGLPKTPRKQRA
jgi:DNA invertase Pin-like site-specific DNA recombinase